MTMVNKKKTVSASERARIAQELVDSMPEDVREAVQAMRRAEVARFEQGTERENHVYQRIY